ncbi:hypothetical protein [Streptomyces brevispora]|uniref:Uncharacterized protein n=1 Tax=Streptomyces brevispora TaxID=887462 RepID=A0A561V5F1_9ACTN|nr:hypothetical protein [Streptomyces brevispora]TWG06841.1 hypothetical protein FHX80_115338 [Streptomyces brevispora]WSC12291.1 hypothetical protein OIE64_05150 [Streptomyces brevispora]
MLLILEIAGVLMLLQGGAPLIQRMSGKDPEESFFIVNSFPDNQGLVSAVLLVGGILLLGAAVRIRRSRKS